MEVEVNVRYVYIRRSASGILPLKELWDGRKWFFF